MSDADVTIPADPKRAHDLDQLLAALLAGRSLSFGEIRSFIAAHEDARDDE